MSISTHVLDTSIGRPAADVQVTLLRQVGSSWLEMGRSSTNADGRIAALYPAESTITPGIYRIIFAVGAYFDRRGAPSFYDAIPIDIVVREGGAHHHVPLLVSPYGYSTYRGS
jgi:5-hydroxyisourate hydrolase